MIEQYGKMSEIDGIQSRTVGQIFDMEDSLSNRFEQLHAVRIQTRSSGVPIFKEGELSSSDTCAASGSLRQTNPTLTKCCYQKKMEKYLDKRAWQLTYECPSPKTSVCRYT